MAQLLEGIPFVIEDYKNCLQYYTNAGKMRQIMPRLQYFTLSKQKPFKRFKLRIKRKNKKMVPYSYLGLLTGFGKVGTLDQMPVPADTTAVAHIYTKVKTRYNEWHQGFNHERT